MAKTMTIKYKDREYTLEYTRKSIEIMEKRGFIISDIEDKPVTTFPMLFAGAFLAHHKFVKPDVIDEIFSKIKDKEKLLGKLAEMYNEPILSMMDEPEEDEGNLDWEASW